MAQPSPLLSAPTDPDDAVSTSSCSPASGATFAIGQTTVTCNATDSHTNSASKTFKVTVVDTTPPVLSSVPADKTVEANSFAGSIVDFVLPTAVDLGEPRIVTCLPARNSTFALGATTVTCSASDGRGNTGTATFKVTVVDTTPPTLIPPGDTSVYATSDTGAAAADQGPITQFIFGSHVATSPTRIQRSALTTPSSSRSARRRCTSPPPMRAGTRRLAAPSSRYSPSRSPGRRHPRCLHPPRTLRRPTSPGSRARVATGVPLSSGPIPRFRTLRPSRSSAERMPRSRASRRPAPSSTTVTAPPMSTRA